MGRNFSQSITDFNLSLGFIDDYYTLVMYIKGELVTLAKILSLMVFGVIYLLITMPMTQVNQGALSYVILF